MSDTPRTDQLERELCEPGLDADDYYSAMLRHARKLERENTALRELRAAVLAYERITDTEYGLGARPDEEKAYNAEFLRLLRALRVSAPDTASK